MCTETYVNTRMRTCIHAYIQAYLHTDTHAFIHIYIYIHMRYVFEPHRLRTPHYQKVAWEEDLSSTDVIRQVQDRASGLTEV